MLETVKQTGDTSHDCSHSSKSSRILTQRLNYERFVHDKKQRNLQKESKAIKEDIEREEKDMIKQLMRLEEEKLLLLKREEAEGQRPFPTSASKEPNYFNNPYPVTLPGGLSLRRHSSLEVIKRPVLKTSAEYEDIDRHRSYSRLPPLANSGRSSPASLPGTLQRSCSSTALLSCSDKPYLFERQPSWIGDPEAIDSIRRPLKGPSRSPRSPRSPGGSAVPDILKSVQIKRCLKSIARSQSMKEKSGSDVAVMFRSRSLKERSKNLKQSNHNQVDDLSDELGDVSLSRSGPFHRQRAVRARHPPTMRDVRENRKMETSNPKCAEGGGPSNTCLEDVSSSSLLQRRRSNKKK